MVLIRLFPLLLFLFATGCASIGKDETADWSAARFYEEAKSALDSGNYTQAIDLYAKLEARYPYGRYAQQAQLETAYAHYKAEEPAAAVAAAERFIKLHPRHPNVDYAYYMRGLAIFEQGKNFLERFLPQDPAQRDPSTARESFNYFRELVEKFPKSRYTPDAFKRMEYLRNNLAWYEVRVADYYMRRKAYLAAANRLRYVVENYQRTPAVPEALAMMVQAYRQLSMNELANDSLRVLEMNYPGDPALLKIQGQ